MIAPDTTLRGALVRLRPLAETDVAALVRWYNDPDVLHWLHRSEEAHATTDAERSRLERAVTDPTQVAWMIETTAGRAIGYVRIEGIDATQARARLAIAIGEKDCWGAGFSTEAIRLVLTHAFERLDLRRIELITDIDNERGIRCYEKCGFVREGVLRQHLLRYGQPLDMLQMAILRHEWEELP
jgi:RimJ/RimL family protein N-acetyltransferase